VVFLLFIWRCIIKDIETAYSSLVSNETSVLKVVLTTAIQSLEFGCPNIVIAVKSKKDVAERMLEAEQIIRKLEYDVQIISYNKIKIKEFQSYITFESVFDKYKDANVVTCSMLNNEVLN